MFEISMKNNCEVFNRKTFIEFFVYVLYQPVLLLGCDALQRGASQSKSNK